MAQTPITAEVYLVAASGKRQIDPKAKVTAKNIDKYRPSATTVAKATRRLRSLGFDVPLAGVTLTLSGPVSLFETVFQMRFDTTGSYPVPISDPVIPVSLRRLVAGITFGGAARLFE